MAAELRLPFCWPLQPTWHVVCYALGMLMRCGFRSGKSVLPLPHQRRWFVFAGSVIWLCSELNLGENECNFVKKRLIYLYDLVERVDEQAIVQTQLKAGCPAVRDKKLLRAGNA